MRSVTTLIEFDDRSLASTMLALTLPVIKVSVERCDRLELNITPSSLTTDFTFWLALAASSAFCL
ncbi:hypothetical protein D3C72_2243220 [compost metagenome]